jgi:hypothetical protein
MTRGVWLAWVGTLLMVLPPGWSEPPPGSGPSHARSTRTMPRPPGPADVPGAAVPVGEHGIVQISYGPAVSRSERLKSKLQTAYLTAVDRLRRGPECRDLFAPFQANGVEMLTRSVYARANAGMETSWCRNAVAGTSVGKKMVFLCRRFSSLPVEEAATILIHEGLHRAGMSESPLDSGSMTGDEISEMVRRACFRSNKARGVMVARREQERINGLSPRQPATVVRTAARIAPVNSAVAPNTTSRPVDVGDMRSTSPY